jgi:deazaflavin-dependent oxidoreductase (nitroreductase family)
MPNPLGNAVLAAVIRSPLHPLLGKSFAVITVTGRKSGRKISTPINVAYLGEGFTVVSFRNRKWWRNLAGGRTGLLRVSGKTIPVAARILDRPEEVREGLKAYFSHYPGYAKYFEIRTDAQGAVDETDLARVAAERLLLQLTPINPARRE